MYPPCNVDSLLKFDIDSRESIVLSIAQFRYFFYLIGRPEKNHKLQIEAFSLLLKKKPDVKLVMIGGVRDEKDQKRVTELKEMAQNLGISVALRLILG